MLSSYYIKENSQIGDAIRAIKTNSTRTIIIVSEELKVLGVLSQGDILEHILYGATVNLQVTSIMNRNFTYFLKGDEWLDETVAKHFKQGKLLIPVLDKTGILDSVISIFDHLEN